MMKSGFVTIIGRPNVGKSTLINRLVGSKIAITSPRPQTTRNRIIGALHRPGAQIVFMDTPGVTKPRSALTKSMVEASVQAGGDADVLLFMSDAARPDIEADRYVLQRMRMRVPKTFLAVNKIDAAAKDTLIESIARLNGIHAFDETLPISARTGQNVDELVRLITDALPEGPEFYPGDMVTDQPERFVIGEIVREKAFLRLQQELPYSVAVRVEAVEDRTETLTAIAATIFVERDSQKGIVIGKGGAMLKAIGSSARHELERRLGTRIFLELTVRVKEKWTGDRRSVHDFGYGTR